MLMKIKGWAPKGRQPGRVTLLPDGRFLGPGVLKEEGILDVLVSPEGPLRSEKLVVP